MVEGRVCHRLGRFALLCFGFGGHCGRFVDGIMIPELFVYCGASVALGEFLRISEKGNRAAGFGRYGRAGELQEILS